LNIGYWNLFDDWRLGFGYSPLALPLFMFGVFTDHPDHPFSFDDLTLITDLSDGGSDFHCFPCLEEIEFKLSIPHLLSGKGERGYLLFPKDNSSPAKIIGGQFQRHLIPGENLDKVHPHLSGDMSQYFMAICQFHPEHGIGKGFQYLSFNLNRLFLWHRIYGIS